MATEFEKGAAQASAQTSAAGAQGTASVQAGGAATVGVASAQVSAATGVVAAAGAAAGGVAGAAMDVAADAVGTVTGAVSSVVGTAMSAVSSVIARIPASLYCIKPPNVGLVPFDFNPEHITMKRQSISTNLNRPARPGSTTPQTPGGTSATSNTTTTSTKAATITISKLVLEGPFTKLRCDTLLAWMTPSQGMLAMLPGNKGVFNAQPAPLMFQWGPPMIGFMYDVKLNSVTVKYTRFTPAGIPIRAEVDITMDEVPSLLGSLPTNPTSGGLPGRRTHVVVDGDSLQSVAHTYYGNPGAWRAIADVNRIADPARLRVGTVVYLPNPDELPTRSAR